MQRRCRLEAARLQLDLEHSTRFDRQGLLINYSRVLGSTTRRLRESLEGQGSIHLCRNPDCRHAGPLHCQSYASVDADALVDLGAYGLSTIAKVGHAVSFPALAARHKGVMHALPQASRRNG